MPVINNCLFSQLNAAVIKNVYLNNAVLKMICFMDI